MFRSEMNLINTPQCFRGNWFPSKYSKSPGILSLEDLLLIFFCRGQWVPIPKSCPSGTLVTRGVLEPWDEKFKATSCCCRLNTHWIRVWWTKVSHFIVFSCWPLFFSLFSPKPPTSTPIALAKGRCLQNSATLAVMVIDCPFQWELNEGIATQFGNTSLGSSSW